MKNYQQQSTNNNNIPVPISELGYVAMSGNQQLSNAPTLQQQAEMLKNNTADNGNQYEQNNYQTYAQQTVSIPVSITDKDNSGNVDNVPPSNNGMTDNNVNADNSKSSKIKNIASWFFLIIVVMFVAMFIRTFLLTPYEIPSGSMEHTLEIDDHIFAEQITYMFSEPQQGDIVTFWDPESIDKKYPRTLIKRVVATEGQTVDIRDGYVYVDGEKQDADYIQGPTEPLDIHMEGVSVSYPYTVPEGEMWVMGDNRTNSLDSRYFGSVPIDTVTGHAIFTYWPIDRIHVLES